MLMKANQKILQLHPHQSKLIDSLCFQLAVNIPDENSLSLLDVLSMRKNNEITNDECKQLYRQWLESKNIFDLFTAKQVKIYPKEDILRPQIFKEHLTIDTINTYLELLHDLYHQLYLDKTKIALSSHRLETIQNLFSYLDNDGNIHLRLSQMFLFSLAFMVHQKYAIPSNYEQFKPYFKGKNQQFCEINGIVSLRWFKNYFLKKDRQQQAKLLMHILRNMQGAIKVSGQKDRKANGLPNVLQQAFIRWKGNSKSSRLFQSKKKRLQIYYRIFDQNQQVFFFNGAKQQQTLSQHFFIKKYGEQLIKALQIDSTLIKQFGDIVKQVLNEYMAIISKLIQGQSNKHQHHRSNTATPYYLGNAKQNNTSYPHSSLLQFNNNASHKKNMNKSYQALNKYSNHKSDIHSVREKTPVKNSYSNIRGNQTKRFKNVTPSNKKSQLSPLIRKEFGSTEKYLSNGKGNLTPTKSSNGGYSGTLYMGNTQQVYKNSKKQGLEKDSFYQKLFFFRNKRVESFDIVIKRLKGK